MKRHKSEVEGASFGIMSGAITILGALIGLSVTGNKALAGLGLIIIGIADALSDAAGIYVSEESEGVHDFKEMFVSAFYAFLAKISMLVVLIIPVLVFDLITGVFISFGLGLIVVGILGYYIGRKMSLKERTAIIIKYVLIVCIIAIISYLAGMFAQNFFMV